MVTRSGLRPATLSRRRRKPPGRVLVALLAEHRVDEFVLPVVRPIEVAPAACDLHVGLVEVPGDAGAAATSAA